MTQTRKYTEEIDEESILPNVAPSEKLPIWRIVLLNVAAIAVNAVAIVQVVVAPVHIEAMVGNAMKGRVLGGMVAASAVLILMLGPPVGVISDRLQCPLGRRRPVMIFSGIILCASLFGLAYSAPYIRITEPLTTNTTECFIDLAVQRCHPYTHPYHNVNGSVIQETHFEHLPTGPEHDTESIKQSNLGLYIFCYMMTMGAVLCFTVSYYALLADMSHQETLSLSSGVQGFMMVTGDIVAAVLGIFFTDIGTLALCSCLVGIFIICTTVTALSVTEVPGKPVPEPIDWKYLLIGFWAPLKDHDFRMVFISRFMVNMGFSTILNFLEYWLEDMVQLPYCLPSPKAAGMMLMSLYVTAAAGSVACGIISDRFGRRKVFVWMPCAMMFAIAITMASVEGEEAFYVALMGSILLGMAVGMFTSVDFALVMEVLVDGKDKAMELAVWHQSLAIPQALATPVGGFVLDVFEELNCQIGLGYILLLVIGSLYFLCGGIVVTKVRGVR